MGFDIMISCIGCTMRLMHYIITNQIKKLCVLQSINFHSYNKMIHIVIKLLLKVIVRQILMYKKSVLNFRKPLLRNKLTKVKLKL